MAEHGCGSYDPYDVWGTRYGLWARKKYYEGSGQGKLAAAPLVLMEAMCPWLRCCWVSRQRFATADAQLILGLLHLWRAGGEGGHLELAVRLGRELMGYAVPGFRGPCWGYPFDWRINAREIWRRDTPFITSTPYGYEAMIALGAATGDPGYEMIGRGIAEFVYGDLREIPTGAGAAAASYSPFDGRRVVNAAAYRAFVLGDAAVRFGREDYGAAARKNLNFVIQCQNEDGSWHYAVEGKPSFIDHFHTCFNLKNLIKLGRTGFDGRLAEVIARGFRFYRDHLFDRSGNPRPYAVAPRLRIVKWEMYDFAEAVNLGTLIGRAAGDGLMMAADLAGRLVNRHQLPDGHFVTRVYRGGLRHRFPFMRWPQAQLFHALAHLHAELKNLESQVEGEANKPLKS